MQLLLDWQVHMHHADGDLSVTPIRAWASWWTLSESNVAGSYVFKHAFDGFVIARELQFGIRIHAKTSSPKTVTKERNMAEVNRGEDTKRKTSRGDKVV